MSPRSYFAGTNDPAVERMLKGLTAERVLVQADSGVHPDLLISRFRYVSVSRASHEATIFTDDAFRLGRQLGTEIGRTSAFVVSQSASGGQNCGLVRNRITTLKSTTKH